LADVCEKFRLYSLEGIELDRERIKKYVNESLMLVTALSPLLGYDKAAYIAEKAYRDKTTLREAAISSGYITPEEFDKIVIPEKMVGNPRRDLGLA
jgi:fumarate hydratase class II